jgi:hypothetical protein
MLNVSVSIGKLDEAFVLAIYNNTGATLRESLLISQIACKNCINELAEEFDISVNTNKITIDSCQFCKN